MWRCPDCGEAIDLPFDVCWNCGTSREGGRSPDFKHADESALQDTENLPEVDMALLTSGPSAAPPPPPKIQFSLRTMLGAVVICAIIFAFATATTAKTAKECCRLGYAHLEREEYPEAVADLTRAIELMEKADEQVDLLNVYACRALAYNNQGEFAKALRDASRALELITPPEDFFLRSVDSYGNPLWMRQVAIDSLHVLRANALAQLGKKEEALAEVNLVLQSDPTHPTALQLLASVEGGEEASD